MTKTQHSKLKHPAPYQREKTLHDVIEFLDEGRSKLFEKYKEVYDVGVEALSENDELRTAYNELLRDHNKVVNGMKHADDKAKATKSSMAVMKQCNKSLQKEKTALERKIKDLNKKLATATEKVNNNSLEKEKLKAAAIIKVAEEKRKQQEATLNNKNLAAAEEAANHRKKQEHSLAVIEAKKKARVEESRARGLAKTVALDEHACSTRHVAALQCNAGDFLRRTAARPSY
jgi:DNA repair exonuclease SbcCD ATPase subunit